MIHHPRSVGSLLVGLLVTLPLIAARPQTSPNDTSYGEVVSSHLSLGAGAYAWASLAYQQINGTACATLAFPTLRRMWVLFDLGFCLKQEEILVGQLGLGARWDIPLAQEIGVYPKVGAGLSFIFGIPVSYVDMGCGMSYRASQKMGYFAEVGILHEPHHGLQVDEMRRLGMYLRIGVSFL